MNRQPPPPRVPPAGRAQGKEEPEQAYEADIPADDGGPADEPQLKRENRPLRDVERE